MPARRILFYISQNYSFAILRPLQKEALARGYQCAWFVEGDKVNKDFFTPKEHQLPSIEAVKQYSPDAVFVPGNVVPNFIPGLKVGVFHGFNSGKKNRKGKEDHFTIRGCFDLYCTQGPNTTEPFLTLEKKHKYFYFKETGWPAIDPLYVQQSREEENNKPTILLCSTFSRNLTCAPHIFDKVKALSATGKWRWLVQFHPKMSQEIVEQYKSIQSKHLTFVETDDVIPLLQEADVMVCDTSSVLLMFLLLNKPVVTVKNIAPKDYMLDIQSPDALEAAIDKALTKPSELMANVEKFIANTHPYNDGKSSQRVLEAVEDILTGKLPNKPNKPLNLLRKFKMRKRLNYWKL